MAEETNGGGAAQPAQPDAAQAQARPSVRVVIQYLKDMSFESPGAPQSLMDRTTRPSINISVGVQANAVSDTDMEVELKLDCRGTEGEQVVFAIEMVYAGIFRMQNVPPEYMNAYTLIECPTLLFPFARQIIAEASRNGGLPPLLIDPIDFAALYRQRIAQQQQAGETPPPAANA